MSEMSRDAVHHLWYMQQASMMSRDAVHHLWYTQQASMTKLHGRQKQT